MKPKIKIILITGFLGAGKTSFLNHLLTENTDKSIKIIENEVGEINIDSKLLRNQNTTSLIEVSQGCICCSVANKLMEAMEEILRDTKPAEYLIIEATGIADPIAIVSPIQSDNFLMQNYEMASVICLVDAVLMPQQVDEYAEIARQISVADFLYINKSDLIIESDKTELEKLVRLYNPIAPIKFIMNGVSDTTSLLKFRMSDAAHTEKQIRRLSAVLLPGHSKIEMSYIELDGYFDLKRFEFWFEYFLTINKNSIIRLKAIIHFRDAGECYVLQSVGTAYTIQDASGLPDISTGLNQFVIIGKNLNTDSIKQSLLYLLEGDLESIIE